MDYILEYLEFIIKDLQYKLDSYFKTSRNFTSLLKLNC